MLAALGSLASWAVPKLLNFASKKIQSTPLGQTIFKTIKSPTVQKVGKNIASNFTRMN